MTLRGFVVAGVIAASSLLSAQQQAAPNSWVVRQPRAVLEPVRRVEAVCARHGIPPGAAALQFSLRDPRIASTICGVSKPERLAETRAWADWPISAEAWDELLALPFSSDDPETTRVYTPG